MRRLLTVLATTAMVAATAFVHASSATDNDTDPAPNTLRMYGDNGDGVVGPNAYAYASPDDPFRVVGTTRSWRIYVANTWEIDVEAQTGHFLETGSIATGAPRFSFNGYAPGFDLSGMGHGCNESTSSFAIRDATYASDDSVTGLVLDFEQHCNGSPPAAHGRVVWHAHHAGSAADPDPQPIEQPVPPGPGQYDSTIKAALPRPTNPSDGYHYFIDATPAEVTLTVVPTPLEGCATAHVEEYLSGRWQLRQLVACVPLKQGATSFRLLRSQVLVGPRFRVRGEWGGDAYTRPSVGTWEYFSFRQ